MENKKKTQRKLFHFDNSKFLSFTPYFSSSGIEGEVSFVNQRNFRARKKNRENTDKQTDLHSLITPDFIIKYINTFFWSSYLQMRNVSNYRLKSLELAMQGHIVGKDCVTCYKEYTE